MRILRILRISGLIILIIVVGGCLSKESQTERISSEAGITITAVNLGNNAFEIKVDTHSGSLDYDMAKISYIRYSNGDIIKPESWKGGIGGHHFEGILTFPKFDDSDFELVIQDVGGVEERILKW